MPPLPHGQIASSEQVHCKEITAFGTVCIQGRNDVWVTERGRRSNFAEKSLLSFSLITKPFLGHDLQSYVTVQRWAFCLEDKPHSPSADVIQQCVFADVEPMMTRQ